MSSSSDPPPPQSQGVLYPAASSSGGGGGGGVGVGRPFIPPKFFRHHPPPEQLVTLANPNPPRPRPSPDPPMPFQPRPPLLQPPSLPSASRLLPAIPSARPLPNSKAAPFPPPSSEFNGLRELNRDDTVVTVQDRKVRFSDGTSLYSLCRSWVRNGLPKETQTNIGNGVKLLPRPLPTATDTGTPEKSESGDEDGDKDKEEDEGSVEHLPTHELLQRHIKRAKRVRARLRKERLQRIGRYKQRLALLLPSSAEHFRSDTAPGS